MKIIGILILIVTAVAGFFRLTQPEEGIERIPEEAKAAARNLEQITKAADVGVTTEKAQ